MPRNELKYLLAEFLDNLCCLCNPLVWSRYRRKRSHRLELMSLNLHSLMQNVHLPTQNLLSDAECKICKYKSLIISAYSSNYMGQIRYYAEGRRRDGKYTKICKYDCRQKKKMQKTAKSIFQFFVYSHSLTRIFAHFCILCEASEMQLPISVHLGTFIFAVLCISL